MFQNVFRNIQSKKYLKQRLNFFILIYSSCGSRKKKVACRKQWPSYSWLIFFYLGSFFFTNDL